MEMRQRELLEFRTPQHPSLGSNHWGGASPLLARNIPKEALDQRYLRLNTVRTRDEIFPARDDDYDDQFSKVSQAPQSEHTRSRRGLLFKLIWPQKEKTTLGDSKSKRKRWLPKWDPKNRWPQGWC